jgi:hypothetical protein
MTDKGIPEELVPLCAAAEMGTYTSMMLYMEMSEGSADEVSAIVAGVLCGIIHFLVEAEPRTTDQTIAATLSKCVLRWGPTIRLAMMKTEGQKQ